MATTAAFIDGIIASAWEPSMLLKDKKCTPEHAKKIINWYRNRQNPNQLPPEPSGEEVAELQKRIDQKRLHINAFTTPKVADVVIRAARKYDFLRRDDGQLPGSLSELKRAFVTSQASPHAKLVAFHDLLYGSFTAATGFDHALEREYKLEHGIVYAQIGNPRGCIGRVINQKRNELRGDFRDYVKRHIQQTLRVRGNGQRDGPWRDEFIVQAAQQPPAPVVEAPEQQLERLLRENPGLVNQINIVDDETNAALQALANRVEEQQDAADRAAAEETRRHERERRERLEQQRRAAVVAADAQARQRVVLIQQQQERDAQEAAARQAANLLNQQQQQGDASNQQHHQAAAAASNGHGGGSSQASAAVGGGAGSVNDARQLQESAHLRGNDVSGNGNQQQDASSGIGAADSSASTRSHEVPAASREESRQTTAVSRANGRRAAAARQDEEATIEANPQGRGGCNHKEYADYKKEDNPTYCSVGELFHGHTCCGVIGENADKSDKICGKKFVDKKPDPANEADEFFPSGLMAICYCPNFGKCGCCQALCTPCYMKALGGRRTRRNRAALYNSSRMAEDG